MESHCVCVRERGMEERREGEREGKGMEGGKDRKYE